MKLAILYAGQGSQHPGMGKDLYERYPAFREAFNAADLDFDLESVCFDDPEGVLNLTQYTQPCMVAFAAGVTAVLKENGVKADDLAGRIPRAGSRRCLHGQAGCGAGRLPRQGHGRRRQGH